MLGMEILKRSESEELSKARDCLNFYDIRPVILSRGRSESISSTKLFPDYVEVIVPESEAEAYSKVVSNPIVTVPDDVRGLGELRNWVLNRFNNETVIMIDDDIVHVYCLTHERTQQINDPDEVMQVLINTAVMAKDMGVHCFGFAQTDIRKYTGCEPFTLASWVGCVIGVIGRNYEFRKDKFKVDIDFCLQNLLVDRIIFQNNMYLFLQKRDNNAGGNSIFRTQKEFEESIDTLLKKWGSCLTKGTFKNQVKLRINVKRRQTIDYK